MNSSRSGERFTPKGWRDPSNDRDRLLVGLATRTTLAFYSPKRERWAQWAATNGIETAHDAVPAHPDDVVVHVKYDGAKVREADDGLHDVLLQITADGHERGCLVTFYDPHGHPLLTSPPVLVP